MKHRVVHVTKYVYQEMATLCHNQVHLMPRQYNRQTCLRFDLQVSPHATLLRNWVDVFGNPVTYFTIEEPHDELTITSRSEVEVTKDTSDVHGSPFSWNDVANQIAHPTDPRLIEAARFIYDSPHVIRSDEALKYAAPSFPEGRPMIEAVLDLTRRLHADLQFDTTATSVSTPIKEVLACGRGVCQDFAHVQIGCLRSLGLAARYMSGYLVTQPPPGRERLVGSDASHAWISVFFPDYGWLDFDPTNNQMPGEEHIVVAWGRDYSDVCPIKGVFLGGGAHSMTVSVDVAYQLSMTPSSEKNG